MIAQLIKWKDLELLDSGFPPFCLAALKDHSSNEVDFCANMFTLLSPGRPPEKMILCLCRTVLFSK